MNKIHETLTHNYANQKPSTPEDDLKQGSSQIPSSGSIDETNFTPAESVTVSDEPPKGIMEKVSAWGLKKTLAIAAVTTAIISTIMNSSTRDSSNDPGNKKVGNPLPFTPEVTRFGVVGQSEKAREGRKQVPEEIAPSLSKQNARAQQSSNKVQPAQKMGTRFGVYTQPTQIVRKDGSIYQP